MTRFATLSTDLPSTPKLPDAVRVALLGLAGGIGYCHISEYENNPHFILVGGYDRFPHEPKVADAIARLLKLGGKVYRSLEEVLADPEVEAVDICAPHHFHRPMAVAAMQAGKHVIVEKPMAPHVDDVEAMLAAQQASGKVGCVQMQHVGRSSMLDLRRAVQAGRIGRIKEVFLNSLWWRTEGYYHRLPWAGKMKVDGAWCIDGALFNQCVHFITQMLVLTAPGVMPACATVKDLRAAVYKFHDTPELQAGDTAFATATLDTADQPRLTMVGTTCSTAERHQIEIIGERGRALWNETGFLFPDGAPMEEYQDDNQLFAGNSRVFNSFAAAIRTGGLALTDWRVFANPTRLIFGCYEAAQWQIKKAPWTATETLFSDVIQRVRQERRLPAELRVPPAWA